LHRGTFTPESARDIRSSRITAIDIRGDDAVAHLREASGTRDLRLRRRKGHWLILSVWSPTERSTCFSWRRRARGPLVQVTGERRQ
jgi:hypothetical protein